MLQHTQLIERAGRLGIAVTDISPLLHQPAAILEHQSISELIIDGIPASWVNLHGQLYCDNKQLAKRAYKVLSIPHPESMAFSTPDDPALPAFFKKDRLYVCKPLDGTNGIGVVMNIKSPDMVNTYFKTFSHLHTRFMLEEQITGRDLRLQVIGGKVVAACIREPAYVTGNGSDTLEDLIAARQKVIASQNPNNRLDIDETTEALLVEQKLRLSDIPAGNRKVQLKYISNMAQGAVATDVTDEIHPVYREWTTALSAYLKTGYMGLDFITTDHQKHPEGHSRLLETNARADWLHHTFSERRTHDIPGLILQTLFVIF